jgi:hypothetical protein
MTATGHALVATLIVAKFPNPYVSLPLALASHFICDMVPHWDSGINHRQKTKTRLFSEATIDVLVSFIASFILYTDVLGQSNYFLLYTGIIVAQLPDWITAPYLIFRIKNPLVDWSKQMYKLQHKLNNRQENPIIGIATQVFVIIALYILLFKIF